jgi:hypothetical protein
MLNLHSFENFAAQCGTIAGMQNILPILVGKSSYLITNTRTMLYTWSFQHQSSR